jgi:protein subunit release factor A
MYVTHAELLERIERCFAKGEIETLVGWDPGPGVTVGPGAAAVKVIHADSGLEATSEGGRSQVRNKAAALLQLLQKFFESADKNQ